MPRAVRTRARCRARGVDLIEVEALGERSGRGLQVDMPVLDQQCECLAHGLGGTAVGEAGVGTGGQARLGGAAVGGLGTHEVADGVPGQEQAGRPPGLAELAGHGQEPFVVFRVDGAGVAVQRHGVQLLVEAGLDADAVPVLEHRERGGLHRAVGRGAGAGIAGGRAAEPAGEGPGEGGLAAVAGAGRDLEHGGIGQQSGGLGEPTATGIVHQRLAVDVLEQAVQLGDRAPGGRGDVACGEVLEEVLLDEEHGPLDPAHPVVHAASCSRCVSSWCSSK